MGLLQTYHSSTTDPKVQALEQQPLLGLMKKTRVRVFCPSNVDTWGPGCGSHI
jgi:hypothetical protein